MFINPEIIWYFGREEHLRGRLPLDPGILRGGRAAGAGEGRYLDLDGKQHEIEADGLLATCMQHEIDHLNGVLFIDHISKLKRDRVIKKFTKAAKRGKPAIESAAELSMPLRLIFMGTPDFAVPTLLEMVGRGHDIAAVYTRAPKPGGRRGLELQPTPVEREARRLRPCRCTRRRR